jgi:hypothetical protein
MFMLRLAPGGSTALARRDDLDSIIVMQARIASMVGRNKSAIDSGGNAPFLITQPGAQLFQRGGLRFPFFAVNRDPQR